MNISLKNKKKEIKVSMGRFTKLLIFILLLTFMGMVFTLIILSMDKPAEPTYIEFNENLTQVIKPTFNVTTTPGKGVCITQENVTRCYDGKKE